MPPFSSLWPLLVLAVANSDAGEDLLGWLGSQRALEDWLWSSSGRGHVIGGRGVAAVMIWGWRWRWRWR